jgi:hypothetical protein
MLRLNASTDLGTNPVVVPGDPPCSGGIGLTKPARPNHRQQDRVLVKTLEEDRDEIVADSNRQLSRKYVLLTEDLGTRVVDQRSSELTVIAR